jgi:serine/threonine protein kinase
MHSLEIIHGDLKLENCLLHPKTAGSVFTQTVKLVDFGFSHHKKIDEKKDSEKKIIRGSLQYMAPEKFKPPSTDTFKCDMWSVGVIAFMLLTGKGVVPANSSFSQVAVFFEKNKGDDLCLSSAMNCFGLSVDAIDFVTRCLQTDPNARLSAREALAHRWLRGMTVKRMSSKLSVISETQRCLESLVKFSQLGPLKRACLGLIAMVCPPLTAMPTSPAIFDLIDTNCDGFIQESELVQIFNSHEINVPSDFFHSLDLSGDHRIHYSEFLAATEVLAQVSGGLSPTYRAIISAVFRKLDSDSSGFISEKNLHHLFGRKGFKGASNSAMLKEGDFTGDGVISESEFFSLITD